MLKSVVSKLKSLFDSSDIGKCKILTMLTSSCYDSRPVFERELYERRVEILLFTELDSFFHQLKFHTFTVECKLMIYRWIR